MALLLLFVVVLGLLMLLLVVIPVVVDWLCFVFFVGVVVCGVGVVEIVS